MDSVSGYDSLLESSHAESISALASHGGRKFTSSLTKYVIHTSSIPLATTMDQQFLLPEQDSESYFHGYQAGEKGEVHCPMRSCMYIKSDRTRGRERLKKNCPCYEVALENGSLQPLCFLVYVRSLNRNLVGTEADADPNQNINPEEVMFCQNSAGIFDNSYPGMVRDRTSLTGWNHVGPRTIMRLMDCLYWFRAFENQYKLKRQLYEHISRFGFKKARHNVMQTLHTLNSLLVKKMIAFSAEIEGYVPLAKHTAWAFSVLMEDYGRSVEIKTFSGELVEPTVGFYIDAKAYANAVKSNFHKEDRYSRLSCLDWRASTKAFGAFFGTELRRLSAYVESVYASTGSDYTLSPAWIFRMTTLAQTRGIGYLPDAIAECKRQAFRNTVNREMVMVEPEMMHLQAVAVQKRLHEGGIPYQVLSKYRLDRLPKEKVELLVDAFSRIDLPIKPTASVDTFVKDGGKVEDARLLLSIARNNRWQIPVRDLETHEILEFLSVSETEREEDTDQISRFLFWISYQLFLNHWIKKGQWAEESEYHEFLKAGSPYEPAIMDAKIVHISEPGKERNLTKSHATLAWLLTPAAKLSQGILAMLPEHRAGLLESGHEWRHQKRISAMSDESGFIYDPMTGKVYKEIRHVFKDWTESTDFICKSVGYAHYRAFLDFVDFPQGYKRLILKTIVEPQPVTEVVSRRFIGDDEIIEPVEWSGSINEGFMMGNPVTKAILHLVHESERAIATHFLKLRGLRFVPNYKFGMFPDQGRIDRKRSSENRSSYLPLVTTEAARRPSLRVVRHS
jgi:hypothetical protein